jgi:hypothetical protein
MNSFKSLSRRSILAYLFCMIVGVNASSATAIGILESIDQGDQVAVSLWQATISIKPSTMRSRCTAPQKRSSWSC